MNLVWFLSKSASSKVYKGYLHVAPGSCTSSDSDYSSAHSALFFLNFKCVMYHHLMLLIVSFLIRCQADQRLTWSWHCRCRLCPCLSWWSRCCPTRWTMTNSRANYSGSRPHLTSWAPYSWCLWRRDLRRSSCFEFIELFIGCSWSSAAACAARRANRYRWPGPRRRCRHPWILVFCCYSWSANRPL